jgi:hypothetical protein
LWRSWDFFCKWTQLRSCSTCWPEYYSIHTFHMFRPISVKLFTRNLENNSDENLGVPWNSTEVRPTLFMWT